MTAKTAKEGPKARAARELRERNAAEAKAAAQPENTATQKAKEAEKNPQIGEDDQKAARAALAQKKISAESYSKVLKGEMTLDEAVNKGPAPKNGKPKEVKGRFKMKLTGESQIEEGTDIWIKMRTWNGRGKYEGYTVASFLEPDGETSHYGKGIGEASYVFLDEVHWTDEPKQPREVVKEVEVEKPVPAPVPDDTTIRQEIENQYLAAWEKSHDSKTETQPYMLLQSGLKQLAESLELGIDFNELDKRGQLTEKKAS